MDQLYEVRLPYVIRCRRMLGSQEFGALAPRTLKLQEDVNFPKPTLAVLGQTMRTQ